MSKRFRIHAIFILIVGGVVIAVAVLLFLRYKRERAVGALPPVVVTTQYNKTLMAGALTIPVSIANTEQSRDQGLSDTSSLPSDAGKLFVFDQPGNPGFWMKDMHYSLDFIWISADMKIVGITPNVAANTYPKIFYPPQQVQYVLEVNANFSTQHGLAVGQQLILQ